MAARIAASSMEYKLKRDEEKIILGWIGKQYWKMNLEFSAVQDGCDPAIFHQKCDNKGPTVTVLWNSEGWVYGGYTSKSWNQTGSFEDDTQAFLFRIRKNNELSPIQFHRNAYTTGICGDSSYGPLFRNSSYHEFVTFYNAQAPKNGVFTMYELENQSGFFHDQVPNSDRSRSVYDFCNNNYTFLDCRVYSLAERSAELEKPWRKVIEKWDEEVMRSMKEEIVAYKPPEELEVEKVNILMLGPVAAGKSSFFNTVNSVYRGHVTAQAVTGTSAHGLTTKYRKYEVRNRSSNPSLKLRLCDTLGLEEKQGLDVTDILYILDGNVPDRFQFNPLARITPGTSGFIQNPQFSDRIHVTAFVLDCRQVEDMPERLVDKMAAIRAQVNERGIPLVVLLTHVDLLLNEPDQLSRAFYNGCILDAVEKTAAIVGVPKGHVLPVKNYESEIELELNVNILALVAMRQILRFADNFFDEQLDLMEQGGACALRSVDLKSQKSAKIEKLDQPN